MEILNRLAVYLDKKAFLSYRLWLFSAQNILRFFPYSYFFHAFLRYPHRFIRGVKTYRRLVQQSKGAPLAGTADFEHLLSLNEKKRFLIAPGFCLKPYDSEKGRSTCPSGHFNHDCSLLNNAEILHHKEKWPKPCKQCGIAPLAEKAAQVGADVYIMTSAIDIARHVYLPAMKGDGARYGLFFLCPYSLEPFTFGLATCGMHGVLVTFCHGDCANHMEWTQADIGIKNEQTKIAARDWQNIVDQLKKMKRNRPSQECMEYTLERHIYRAKV